jgi:hypothetical protein
MKSKRTAAALVMAAFLSASCVTSQQNKQFRQQVISVLGARIQSGMDITSGGGGFIECEDAVYAWEDVTRRKQDEARAIFRD